MGYSLYQFRFVLVPEALLQSLEGVAGFDRAAFERVHEQEQPVTSIRLNPQKLPVVNEKWAVGNFFHHTTFAVESSVPWSDFGYYLSRRPSFTFDPFFHAGCYYVQEASSMFLEQAIKQTVNLSQPVKVLDLCAAPGGKSTHIQSLLSANSLLVSNEVIKNRSHILKQNIIKWGSHNVIVTNNDPQHMAKLPGFFDVMVVDAPCSGSGLFRKEAAAVEEWSEDAVQLCSGRQKRILSDALPALKQGGVLIYSTCSYSPEEDEDIADWLVRDRDMEPVKLSVPADWNIVETISSTGATGYRFYPDKVKGEGFFISCFVNRKESLAKNSKPLKSEKATAKERAVVDAWANTKNLELLKHNNTIFALEASAVSDFAVIKQALNVQYAGTFAGEVIREKLIPDHALAVSTLLAETVNSIEVPYDEAIKYLQKKETAWDTVVTGWQVVTYKGKPLGWINALPNRINNYYPKEFRILKLQDDSAFEK